MLLLGFGGLSAPLMSLEEALEMVGVVLVIQALMLRLAPSRTARSERLLGRA